MALLSISRPAPTQTFRTTPRLLAFNTTPTRADAGAITERGRTNRR